MSYSISALLLVDGVDWIALAKEARVRYAEQAGSRK